MMYRWVYTNDLKQTLYDVGIRQDGSLHNPNNYPDDLVRKSIAGAVRRQHERRSNAAKQAATTREKRKQLMVWKVAQASVAKRTVQAKPELWDLAARGSAIVKSIERSIGSDCWQHVLQAITKLREGSAA